MPGSRRCVIQYYNDYDTPEDTTFTARTWGLGVCCILSMDRFANTVSNETQFAPPFNPRAESRCQTLGKAQLISTFCKARFTSIPLKDQSEWDRKIRAAFECLNFVTSTAFEHQDELRACLSGIESALREAELETKPSLTGSEISTVKVVQDILEHLDNALTRFCPRAFTPSLRKSVANIKGICKAFSDRASLSGSEEAWHNGAKSLLAQASLANDQAHHLSNDEQRIPPQIMKVALDLGPLFPRLTDCAKFRYDRIENFFPAQESPHNADMVSPESFGHQQVLSQSEISQHREMAHSNLDIATDTKLTGMEFWTHPSLVPRQCVLLDESFLIEELPQCEAVPGGSSHVEHDVVNDAARGVSTEDSRVSHDDARHQLLGLLQEKVASLVTAIEKALLHITRGCGPTRRMIVQRQLRGMMEALSQLNEKPPPFDPLALAVLGSMRSSLMAARAKIKFSEEIEMSERHRAQLNKAIIMLSRLWHQARLTNLEGTDALRHQELESLKMVAYPLKVPSSSVGCTAFTAYTALLSTDSQEKAEEVLDDFLTFFDLGNKSIDSSTAQLYLSILLYLKHDNAKLLRPEAQKSLDKLIVRLRDEIFGAAKNEIPISNLPENIAFYLAYFPANTWQGFVWRDSLREYPTSASDWQRPIITRLDHFGNSFRKGLNGLTNLTTFHHQGAHATQVKSLAGFLTHLLRISPPECVFADDQTLAYLKQFAAFAERCLDECQVDGTATGHHQLPVLEVTLDCLQWCRLLSSYLEVTSPSILEEAYDTTANALILKCLWSSRSTTCMLNSERAVISQGLLSTLGSNKLDDELLTCIKMFLDQSVPSRFVARIFDELLLNRSKQNSDHDKMVTLLALECRIQLFRAEVAPRSGIAGIPPSVIESFTEALAQVRMVAKGVQTLLDSALTLNASLHQRFVAPSAHEAARQLSIDVVLEEALRNTDLNHLTVSEVAYHVATYLLGDCTDERWLDFLTCQVKWCSLTPLQLAEHEGEVKTLVHNLRTLLKTLWPKVRWVEITPASSTATPDLIRHFVHMITLKWLSTRIWEISQCSHNTKRLLDSAVGEHLSVWMPQWFRLMYSHQALFPANVSVTTDFFEKLCINVANRRKTRDLPSNCSNVLLDSMDVSSHLSRSLYRVSKGTLTNQDLKFLLKQHASPMLSRPNQNMFLALLLWAWHHGSFLVDPKVVQRCFEKVFYEGARPEYGGRVPVETVQQCIRELLSSSSASDRTTQY